MPLRKQAERLTNTASQLQWDWTLHALSDSPHRTLEPSPGKSHILTASFDRRAHLWQRGAQPSRDLPCSRPQSASMG